MNPNPIITPTEDGVTRREILDIVPSAVMANHILNSENKIELVRGLIEDKRALSFEIDELEKKVTHLEAREKSNTYYIHHLLQRTSELGNKNASVKDLLAKAREMLSQ
jgi:ethanolamine utilization microcompartment shell protein EutL